MKTTLSICTNIYIFLIAFYFLTTSYAEDLAEGEFEMEFEGIQIILSGDYADPSIVRDGNDFYMTHSSYDYLPGLLIWHSQDLLHWERLCHALHTPIRDVWAPDFIKHNDLFYIYFPAAGTNWVITAPHPTGPWSEPTDLQVGGIDPGHIATPDGKRYLYLDNGYYYRLTDDGLSVVGEREKGYSGWIYPSDWVTEGFCLESPKLFFREPYYYLISAQGGTAGPSTSHMVVSARATSPEGPWENDPDNPIIRTWDRNEQWWSKGHGTVIDDAQGNWYIVYHAYRNGHYPLGRHTLLEPIEWSEDRWFHTHRDKHVEGLVQYHNNTSPVSDTFTLPNLHSQWRFSGIDHMDAIHLINGSLSFKTNQDKPVLMHVLNDVPSYEVTTLISIEGNVEVGLYTYYNEQARAGVVVQDGISVFVDRQKRIPGPLVQDKNRFYLRIRQDRYDFAAFVSSDGKQWLMCSSAAEVSGFHHNVFGGFTSLRIVIQGIGEGVVHVEDFQYTALE